MTALTVEPIGVDLLVAIDQRIDANEVDALRRTPQLLDRSRAPHAPSPPGQNAATPTRPVEDPITICAEYLALCVIRRRGLTDRDAEYVAELTGLPVMVCARLARVRDVGEFTSRRAVLEQYVGWAP